MKAVDANENVPYRILAIIAANPWPHGLEK